jgi:two-component system OmpR family sensor kinase
MKAGMDTRSRWYRSFYWRIGVSFVVLVVVVLVAQSVFVGFWLARANVEDTTHSPNNRAARIAADLGARLAQDGAQDLTVNLHAYLAAQHDRGPGVFVVMKDGRAASSSDEPLPDEIRRSAHAALAGVDLSRSGAPPKLSGAFVSAPILVGSDLRGLVVLPPPPARGEIARNVGRLLSLPGTLLLIAATVLAAVLIFTPARRRLRELEEAAQRLGEGDLTARAPERGGDEIARVAHAFNTMATELSARDEALRTSDRLRRQMLADVSHELKTPLTSMRGYLETLQMPDVAVDPETRARYFQTVERETRRLEHIVADLLDLARYENGVAALNPRVFAMPRLFEHIAQRHEREVRARDIVLSTHVAPEADQVIADPDRLEQALENLVANALRHTPRDGTIDVRATMDDGMLVLEVIDSGTGIGPEHLAHVFDRFYKVEASRTASAASESVASGSGLGLSIVKAIVERHDGTISVTSVPGRTIFRITLPQSAADRAALSTLSTLSPEPGPVAQAQAEAEAAADKPSAGPRDATTDVTSPASRRAHSPSTNL